MFVAHTHIRHTRHTSHTEPKRLTAASSHSFKSFVCIHFINCIWRIRNWFRVIFARTYWRTGTRGRRTHTAPAYNGTTPLPYVALLFYGRFTFALESMWTANIMGISGLHSNFIIYLLLFNILSDGERIAVSTTSVCGGWERWTTINTLSICLFALARDFFCSVRISQFV